MDKDEIKAKIRSNVKFETVNNNKTGGQTVGMPYYRQRLYSEDLDLTIETGFHRSITKNRELLFTLFDLALDDVLR